MKKLTGGVTAALGAGRWSILFVLLTWHAAAQSAGTFVGTGSMTIPGWVQAATLLKDGRVLMTGSVSTQLYDPSTGIFTPTGDMWPHSGPALLLLDGRVLITGDHPEFYDPATGSFTPAGDLTRGGVSADLLSDGKVFVTDRSGPALFDPASGTSINLAVTPVPDHAIVLRDDGVLASVWNTGISLYKITADSLKFVRPITINYFEQSSTLLGDGRVLIAGGWEQDYLTPGVRADALLYDPRRGTVEPTGHLLFPRASYATTLLPGGHVLIVGGSDGNTSWYCCVPEAEEYDPASGSFTRAGTTNVGHVRYTTLLNDGTVLIVGGENGTTVAELYIPKVRAASAASFSGALAPDSLASLFGSRMARVTEGANPLTPPTSLGGISLRLVDSSGVARLAPLLYVSPSQINFEVPAGTATGKMTLEVVNAPTPIAGVEAQVNPTAPALFSYGDNTVAAYGVRVELDGRQSGLSVLDPIVLDDRPTYLVLYGTGIRNRSSLANVECAIGGIRLPVEYAGPDGDGVPGLDQVNVRLTSALKGLGLAKLVLTVDGVPSNSASVEIR